MTFAILSMGTALPATTISQQDALGVARALCCPTEEQATWLPSMYDNTGIKRRCLVLGADLVRDLLEGTRHSGSPFLPGGTQDDHGPSTAERMRHSARLPPPLALESAGCALQRSGLTARSLTH